MAYTEPPPGVTGDLWTAPFHNTYLVNNFINHEARLVVLEGAGGAPGYRKGMHIEWVDTGKLRVSAGILEINGVLLEEQQDSGLIALATAGNWVNGAEGASMWVYVYALDDGAGGVTIKLSDQPPLYPECNTASLVFKAQSNSNPAAGATTFTCDNDTGEANIRAGDILRAWTDSVYGAVRGGYEVVSYVAGTNTFTVVHNDVDLADNDYLTIAKGQPRYRQYSGVWYRCLGALRNNAASNLLKVYKDRVTGLVVYDDPSIDWRVLSAGHATVFTDVSCQTAVPPYVTHMFTFLQIVAVASGYIATRPNGSASGWQAVCSGGVSIAAPSFVVLSPNQCLEYMVNLATTSGYIDPCGFFEID